MFGSNEDGGQGQSGSQNYMADQQTMNALGFGAPGAGQTPMGNMQFAAQNYGDMGGAYGAGGGGRGARNASVAARPVQAATYSTPAAISTYSTSVEQIAAGYRPANVVPVVRTTAPAGYVPPYQAIQPAFWWTTDPAMAQAAAAGDPEAQAKLAAQQAQGGGITWTKILIGVTLVGAAAGGYYYWKRRKGSGGRKRASANDED
jgi:hypothetical protein